MTEANYVILVYSFAIILLLLCMLKNIIQLRFQNKILKTNETKI